MVTELSRWDRRTQDLMQTLDDLHSWYVSVLAQTGRSFDLGTAMPPLCWIRCHKLAAFEYLFYRCAPSRRVASICRAALLPSRAHR